MLEYLYDPYGNPLQATALLTDYGFAGMVYNADSGLDLARNRIYDPIIGRWLSRDPSGESADRQGNLYAYAEEDPVNQINPSGLISQEEAAGLIALTQAIGLGPEDPAADAISAAIEEDALADAATAETNDAEATGGEAAQCLATQGERAAAETAGGISEKGIANIEQHLSNLDALENFAPNQAMIARLRAGLTESQDLNFYEHETIESQLMSGGMEARDAHLQTLEQQGIPYAPGYDSQLYHPSVISQYLDFFNPAAHP